MFPIATNGGGMCQGFPDVCKVPAPPAPPIPVPFPNIAQLAQANGGTCSKRVKVMNKKVVTVKTKIPKSMGDEAGVAGGVVSGMNMGPVGFKVGVPKIKIEGSDVINHLKTSGHNGSNANQPAGSHVAPSQSKVLANG